jgi:RecB family exonuclease
MGKTKAMEMGTQLHEFYDKLNKIDIANDETAAALSQHPEGKAIVTAFKKQYPAEYMKFHNVWRPYRRALPRGPLEYSEHQDRMLIEIPNSPVSNTTLMGIMDYTNLNARGKAIIVDFKSGSSQDSPSYRDQAALYALITMSVYPQVQEVKTVIFDISSTQRGALDTGTFYFLRERDYEPLRLATQKMIGTIVEAVVNDKFPATPCNKCSYCPDATCKFNKNWRIKGQPLAEALSALPPQEENSNNPTVETKQESSLFMPSKNAIIDGGEPESVSMSSVFGSFELGEKEKAALIAIREHLASMPSKLEKKENAESESESSKDTQTQSKATIKTIKIPIAKTEGRSKK